MANRPFHPSRCIDRRDRAALACALPRFETLEQALQQRAKDIVVLRGANSEIAIDLVERLRTCTRQNLCGSAACRLDQREFRIWLATAAPAALTDRGWTPGQGWVASIVPDVRFSLNGFTVDQLRAFRQRLRDGISRAGLSSELVIGGVDFSINTFPDDPIGYIHPHAYLLFPFLADAHAAAMALRHEFPSSERVLRPVKFRQLDDIRAALTYANKSHFVRRSSYVNGSGRRCTRDFPLRGDVLINLLLSLDQLALTSRLVLMNVRRQGCALEICRDEAQPRRLRAPESS